MGLLDELTKEPSENEAKPISDRSCVVSIGVFLHYRSSSPGTPYCPTQYDSPFGGSGRLHDVFSLPSGGHLPLRQLVHCPGCGRRSTLYRRNWREKT